MHHIAFVFMLCSMGLMYNACKEEEKTDPAAGGFTVNGSARHIEVFYDEPQFPDGEGKSLFISNCNICHSLRYISSQPNFPRKTWEAEVHKMVSKYHASIDSDVAVKIVDYLVAIKGVEG